MCVSSSSDGTPLQQRRLDLHVRRARAYTDIGAWAMGRHDLEEALKQVAPVDRIRRAELLLELSKCSFWMLDVPAVRLYAQEALTLAESLGRDDLAAEAMSWLAGVLNSEGDVPAAVEMDRRAMARIGGARTFGLARAVISLYHLGEIDEAIERAEQSLESARTTQDPTFRVYALEHLALSLTGAGRYAEARRTFDEMRDFGRRHGTLPMLARGIAMSAGLHIALGDYATGEAIAHEARELARRIVFGPPFVSAGVDLLTVHARTHEPGRAELLIDDVAKAVADSSGWHGWLWRLRLSQARAELALARQDWQTAVDRATEGITESRARSRPKYVALGLLTRAQAKRHRQDVPGAIEDASAAVAVARTLRDPAVLLSSLTTLLAVEGNDALLAEARGCVERMAANIDAAELRQCFLDSDIARAVGSLGA